MFFNLLLILLWRNIHIALQDRMCKICVSLVVEDQYHLIFKCSLFKNIRDPSLQHVGNTVRMFISKQFVSYFAKIISEMIEVRHGKVFVKTY